MARPICKPGRSAWEELEVALANQTIRLRAVLLCWCCIRKGLWLDVRSSCSGRGSHTKRGLVESAELWSGAFTVATGQTPQSSLRTVLAFHRKTKYIHYWTSHIPRTGNSQFLLYCELLKKPKAPPPQRELSQFLQGFYWPQSDQLLMKEQY